MIRPRRSADRGHADHGWLQTYHTFSFADYYDPDFMGFGPLRVINQDVVRAGAGFPTHGHRDMEIVTYMLEGTLEHRDSMGNGSRMGPGEVQLMSAGTGVTHSEFNASPSERLELLQMWVLPARQGRPPRYEQKQFGCEGRRGRLRLLVSPDGSDGSLTIGQDVRLYDGLFDAGDRASITLRPGRSAWVHVARGALAVNGIALGPGDGAAVSAESELVVTGERAGECILWDLP